MAEDRALIACHICDALLYEPEGTTLRARCPRCGTVAAEGRGHSTDGVIACAVATLTLMMAALALPFVSMRAGGTAREADLIDAAMAAGGTAGGPLALAVFAMIAAVPMVRAAALLYVLLPIRLGAAIPSGARAAFRLAITLRPWSMVEIFIVGVVVALVKIAGLATVGLGAAFWIFVALAVVAFYEDVSLCRRTVWRSLG